jgi:DNA-directed RNA polymerase I, II, and III subunit RPABC2
MSTYFEDDDDKMVDVDSDDSASVDSSVASSNNEIIDDDNDVLDDDVEENEELAEDDDDDVELEDAEVELDEDTDNEQPEEVKNEGVKKRTKKVPAATVYKKPVDELSDDSDEDDDGENYLQKFDKDLNENYITNFHPECAIQNYDEIMSMITVIRDKDGIIIDDLHKTVPFLTKFEKARILGQRAKQINSGATPFVKVPENVIDGYLIAEMELKEKRIPFIVRRPLPNGGSEYWSIKDLENIVF